MEQSKCYIVDFYHLKKDLQKKILSKGTIIKIAGITLILLVGLPDVTHAATGIDAGADKIYKKLLNVGKWVIICKGGIETIQNAAQGDMQTAKKNFLSYLLVYAILYALPWGMKQIDNLFAEI